jgi:hypothetical protein
MFGLYDQYPLFYDRKRGVVSRPWESVKSRAVNVPGPTGDEHYNDLLREADQYRLAMRLPQRPSLASQAWSRAQDVLSEITCRVRSYAFRQPCPEPVA